MDGRPRDKTPGDPTPGAPGDGPPESLRLLADLVPTFLWTAGPDGAIAFRNRQWHDYVGLSPADLAGGDDPALHPEDREPAERAWADARRTGCEHEHIARYRRHDGAYRWFLTRARPLLDERGGIREWYGTTVDIHDRVIAEAALRDSEARFRTVFGAIDEGYCLCEMIIGDDGRPVDYRFLEVNPLFESMTGLADAVGRTAHEMLPDLERHWVETYARVGLGGETLRFSSGSEVMGRWFDVFATRVEPHGRFALVFKDVTERKRAQDERERLVAALRRSEERLALALRAAKLAVHDLDLRTGHREWDEIKRALWGIPPEETVTAEAVLAGIHPDDRAMVAATLERATHPDGPCAYEIEYRVVNRSDGRTRWIWSVGSSVFEDGVPVRVVGAVLDVTERKDAIERQALLAREVDHRAKNALAIVQSVVRLTRADDLAQYVATVEGRIDALACAHTLLAEGGWKNVNLRRLLERELAAYGIERMLLRGDDVVLPANAAQPFALAIHELATNAAKHGALSASDGRVDVAWRFDAAGKDLYLTWRERGGPRVAPPARHGFGSTLIGAVLERQLGGRVTQHWHGDGLECEIVLRLGRRPRPTPGAAERGANDDAPRALVVEDDALIALDIERILDEAGYRVVGRAARIDEALELLDAVEVDVAVLDANLDGEGAGPVADRLAGLDVPFVVVSGYENVADIEAARSAPLLIKPFAPDDLRRTLRDLLDGT